MRLRKIFKQVELHFLRTRLLGGKLNKAKKGELRFSLPVGFRYEERGRIIPDPDAKVREVVASLLRRGLPLHSYPRILPSRVILSATLLRLVCRLGGAAL